MRSKSINKGFLAFLLGFYYYILVFHQQEGSMTLTVLFSLLLLMVFANNAVYSHKNIALIFLYGISLSAICFFKGLFKLPSVIETTLMPLSFYIFGSYMAEYYYSDQKKLLRFLLLTALCFGLFYYYWSVRDIVETGAIISANRWLTINGTTAGATNIGTNTCLGLVGLAVFFVIKNKMLKWMFLFSWLLSIITTIHMINRSGIIISIICLAVVLLSYFKGTKHFSKIIWLLAFLLIVGVVVSKVTSFGEVFDAYALREEGDDGTVLADGGGRTVRWVDAIMELPNHPLGWESSAKGYNYVHNMWLDIAKQAGWIPFFLLILITYRIIVSIRRLLRIDNSSVAYTLLGLNTCIFFAALVEPVVGGVFFACYCMIWGVQERYYLVNKLDAR